MSFIFIAVVSLWNTYYIIFWFFLSFLFLSLFLLDLFSRQFLQFYLQSFFEVFSLAIVFFISQSASSFSEYSFFVTSYSCLIVITSLSELFFLTFFGKFYSVPCAVFTISCGSEARLLSSEVQWGRKWGNLIFQDVALDSISFFSVWRIDPSHPQLYLVSTVFFFSLSVLKEICLLGIKQMTWKFQSILRLPSNLSVFSLFQDSFLEALGVLLIPKAFWGPGTQISLLVVSSLLTSYSAREVSAVSADSHLLS